MSKNVYRVQLPPDFKDTGFVRHQFNDGAYIESKVHESGDSGGFCIQLIMTDGDGNTVCDVTLDRFAGLCVADVITKALLNQEEIVNERNYEFERAFRARETMGKGQEAE